jgi:hypothetical protein
LGRPVCCITYKKEERRNQSERDKEKEEKEEGKRSSKLEGKEEEEEEKYVLTHIVRCCFEKRTASRIAYLWSEPSLRPRDGCCHLYSLFFLNQRPKV